MASKSGVFPQDVNAASLQRHGQGSLQEYFSFFFECCLPSGATGSQSDGRLGVNCEPGERRAFSQFTSTIQILQKSCMEINEAHRSAPALYVAHGERRTVFARLRCQFDYSNQFNGKMWYYRRLAFVIIIYTQVQTGILLCSVSTSNTTRPLNRAFRNVSDTTSVEVLNVDF